MYARNLIFMSCPELLAASMAVATSALAQPYGYVSNQMGNSVAVVDRAANTVIAKIFISAAGLSGLTVTPDGSHPYVAEQSKNSVGVISTATNREVAAIPAGHGPVQIAITPDGTPAYVANQLSNDVSVIDTSRAGGLTRQAL